MSAAYLDAIVALIEAGDPRLAGRVFDTALERDGTPRKGTYVVIFLGNPDLQPGRLTMAQTPDSDAVIDFTVRCVTEGADGLRDIASSTFNALVGKKPAVDGRSCSKIAHRAGDHFGWDTDATPPAYLADDDYRFSSYAA